MTAALPIADRPRSLSAAYEELNLLYSLTSLLGHLTTEDEITAAALREAASVTRSQCGWFVVCHESEPGISGSTRGITAETAACVTRAALPFDSALCPDHRIVHDLGEEFGICAIDAPARLLACEVRGGRRAWLCLGRTLESDIFTSDDQRLLSAVAALTGIALENVRLREQQVEQERLAGELDMAKSIQRSLLPQDSHDLPWMDAAGESIPCYEIGGDYYDVVRLSSEECLFLIADVSGKGPAAALRAATVQGNVHALCRNPVSNTVSLPNVLQTINEAILGRASDTAGFVTACVAVLSADGRLRYSNAGHNRPICIPTSGPLLEFPEGGLLLGVLHDASFPEESRVLTPGDLVLFYTDGVTDCENAQGETFDLLRLRAWAARQAGRSPAALREDLIAELARFSGVRRHPDDLTFLILQYRGR